MPRDGHSSLSKNILAIIDELFLDLLATLTCYKQSKHSYQAAVGDDIEDGGRHVVNGDSRITIWNDRDVYQPKHLRSHMVHGSFDFVVGYGANIHTKRGWNGSNLEGLKTTDKEMKKRLRVINFKEKKPAENGFEMPVFDDINGTYDFKNIKWEYYEEDKPLIPAKSVAVRKTFIL